MMVEEEEKEGGWFPSVSQKAFLPICSWPPSSHFVSSEQKILNFSLDPVQLFSGSPAQTYGGF